MKIKNGNRTDMFKKVHSVLIDSKNITRGEVTDFEVELDKPIKNVSGFRIVKCYVPYSFYNVKSSNNIIDLNSAGIHALVIPIGQYNGTELAAEIETQLQTVSGQFRCEFDVNTLKFTIRRTDATNFTLQWLTGANAAISIGTFIGFDVTSDDTGTNGYLADFVAKLTMRYINIESNRLSSKMNGKNYNNIRNATKLMDCSTILRVPIINEIGSPILYRNFYDEKNYLDGGVIETIDLKLRCEDMQVIDLNGHDWFIELEFYSSLDSKFQRL